MSKVHGVNIVACMPILPFLKMETKMEIKQGPAENLPREPVPSTSQRLVMPPADTRMEETPSEVTEEEGDEKEDDDAETKVTDGYFKKYVLTGKGKDLEEKINEAY